MPRAPALSQGGRYRRPLWTLTSHQPNPSDLQSVHSHASNFPGMSWKMTNPPVLPGEMSSRLVHGGCIVSVDEST